MPDFLEAFYYWSTDLNDVLCYLDETSLEDKQSTASSIKEDGDAITIV